MNFERTAYRVFRTCPRCFGSGAGKTCQNCVRCQGEGGRFFELYAEELTNPEINRMSVEVQIRISIEVDALLARNTAAREYSEKSTWEDKHTPRLSDGSAAPIQTKRRPRSLPEAPSGKDHRSAQAWFLYLDRMDRFEAQNGDSGGLGKRSYGLRGQRLMA